MKKFFSNFKAGAAAVLVAILLVATQSAFKAGSTTTAYGKHVNGSNVYWIPLDDLSQQPPNAPLGESEYRCDASDIQNCTALFDSQPAVNTPDPNNGSVGQFVYNP
ncbi:hypothetical protein [Pedobacter sp.]|uniref:hypothetical protein n=1 Tax=Pedobacter sp. TaxID=1411316 RepID=UPI003BAA448F